MRPCFQVSEPDKAADELGWDNVFHCENSQFCQTVLKYHWPKSITYGDIRKTDFSIHRNKIDVLSGGDPCQGNSVIGLRDGEDSVYFLWPDFVRAAKEINPIALVNENVGGQISNGVLERKIADIEALGYEVWPPIVIPACYTGHYILRERVFIVAISTSRRLEGRKFSKANRQRENKRVSVSPLVEVKDGQLIPQPEFHQSNYGLPGNLDGITLSKWKKESIMAYGNTIVPEVAKVIFSLVDEYLTSSSQP